MITARELNRATLERQLLLERAPLSVTDGVRRVVALQAQQPASAYLALWNRLAGFDPAELDDAFASHRVVRAQLMRVTMHAVHAEDHQVVPRGDGPDAAGVPAGRSPLHGVRADRRRMPLI